jgi:hypothetical protein
MRLLLFTTMFVVAGCGCRPSPPATELAVDIPVEPDLPPAVERTSPPD